MPPRLGFLLSLCLCLWLAATEPVFGQATAWPHALRFQRFEHNQALSNLAVHTLAQDRFGLLWIGTEDGLNRYDGHGIKRYRHRPDDPYSLPANVVFKLHAARDGTLWMLLGDRTLCRYDWQQDRFLREPLDLPEPSNWRFDILAEDQQGHLWLAGQTTLVRYDPRTKTSRSFALPEVKPPETALAQPIGIYGLTVDQQGGIWVNVSFRLCRFYPETGALKVTEVNLDHNQPLLAHPNGYLYGAAKVDGQLRLLEIAPETAQVVGQYPIKQRPVLAVETSVQFFAADGDLLWVAINGVGVGRFNTRTKALDYAVYDRANPRSLAGGEPLVILRDRSGVLWVGDLRQGLSLLAPYAAYFKTYRSDPNRPEHLSLSDGFIRGLCEDRAGNIWVATQYGGLNCLVARTRTIRHFRHRSGDATSLAHDAVWTVLEDRQGRLWVGSLGGLQSFDPQRERFTTFPLPPDKAGQQPAVHALFEDADGTLWVGSSPRIFAILPDRHRITEPLAARLTELSLTEGVEVQAFYRDAQGALWIGLSHGALRLAPDGQTLRYFREELGKSVSGAPMVCSFLTDSAGRFWLATKGMGLLQYDPVHDRFQALTEHDGLPHNNVYAVLEDRQGRLWISTDDGIARYEPRTGRLRHYRAEEGLQGREFNRRAFLQTRSGVIFFGGTQGLTAFPPDELKDNPYPPPIVAFVQTGQQTRLVTPESPPVDIPRDERAVNFQLAALDFNAPQANQYAYRVEGQDTVWRMLGRQSTLTLANLSPGDWVIHVKASNNDGIWNEVGLRIHLYVQPPWWRTTWAYTSYLLLGTLLVWGGYRLRRDRERLLMRTRIAQARLAAQIRAKQRRIKLNRLLAYKNRELLEANDRLRQLDEVKQRFTAMLVHDLKAPLASVLMLLELLKTLLGDKIDPEITEIMNNTAQSAERTLQLINEMLEVMRSEAGGLQLDMHEIDPRTVLESALVTILPLSRNKQQTVESEIAADLPSLKADGQKLERALVNLLSNAVKYTPEGGRIWLKAKVLQGIGVDRGRNFLLIEVGDTGVGIPDTELPYIFDPYRQATKGHTVGAGLGLAIVRNIIAAHGGNVTVRSQVGVGTTFWVTLPLPPTTLLNQNQDHSDEPASAS